MLKQVQEPLPVLVRFASDAHALTLQEIQQGQAIGALMRVIQVLMHLDQKETPKPDESEASLVQAS